MNKPPHKSTGNLTQALCPCKTSKVSCGKGFTVNCYISISYLFYTYVPIYKFINHRKVVLQRIGVISQCTGYPWLARTEYGKP